MPTLAEILRQTGYSQDGTLATPTPTDSPMTKALSEHIKSLPQTTMQNLAKQRQDIDAALQMTLQGMQIADQGAFNRFMGEVPNVAALTAWHGTPHQIKGAFDISKVGTGEGAQAYGHGMYFAENPAVAGEYARALAEKPKDVINGYINYSAKYGRPKGEGNTSLGYLQSQGFPIENAPLLDKIIAGANVDKQGNVNFSSSAIKELSNLESAMASKGNLYKVDIPDADIPNMLDWDKPLSQQSGIIEKLKGLGDDKLSKLGINPNFTRRSTGKELTGESLYDVLTTSNSQKGASNLLAKQGITGIRYFDQGSRPTTGGELVGISKTPDGYVSKIKMENRGGAGFSTPTQQFTSSAPFKTKAEAKAWANSKIGTGTSNFVVFEPFTVKILEENGKPLARKELIEQQVNKVLE